MPPRRAWLLTTLLVLGPYLIAAPAAATAPVVVGSKQFTEGVILGEVVRLLIADGGQPVVHQAELGGTRILWGALLAGEIDVYPEYSGTLIREVMAGQGIETLAQLAEVLAGLGLRMSAPLGFQNTYAITVPEHLGARLMLHRVSDLRDHPQLRFGFSSEFMDREDGWPGLRDRYRLPQQEVRGLDHDLAYRGLAAGQLDASDAYTTDAEIAHYGLRLLTDDLGWFPVPLGIVAARRPRLGALVLGLTGILQTIPSLALLVLLIPALGIGWRPAVVALFLYSLLPIVRNTQAGLLDIPLPLRESADVLGLTRGARLRRVELPLAATAILAGIKTAAVINVGTATLAALIGAGGYGQPILTGIRLDDTALIMQGAIPAALLALLIQGLFNWAERRVVPRGLRPLSGAAAP